MLSWFLLTNMIVNDIFLLVIKKEADFKVEGMHKNMGGNINGIEKPVLDVEDIQQYLSIGRRQAYELVNSVNFMW